MRSLGVACVLALVACSRPATISARAVAGAAPVPVPLLAASPGASIEVVALTDDAVAASTIDAAGAVRLWPSLDGTREPLVVPGPEAIQLAIVHDEAGLALATIDDAGSLRVVRVDNAGYELGARQVHVDVAVTGVEPSSAGFVSLLADGTAVEVDVAGAVTASLRAAGRIDAVLTRGARVLALVEDRGGIIGRWVSDGAWTGPPTPRLAVDPTRAVLAPDGAHVATASRTGLELVDLATGRSVAPPTATCEPIAYVDAQTVVCVKGRRLMWFANGVYLTDARLDGNRMRGAAADHLVVTGARAALELDAPHTRHFLGYRTQIPGVLRSTPRGLAIGGQAWFALDAGLQIERQLAASAVDVMSDVMPLDAETTLAIVDHHLRRMGGDPILDDVVGTEIAYEPTTHLLAVARTGSVAFMKLDAHGVVGPPVSFTTNRDAIDQVILLDPGLAHGQVAAVIHRATVYELGERELGGNIATRPPVRGGRIRGVDRAGRVYGVDTPGLGFVGDVQLASSDGAALFKPNADGSLIAVIADAWLALYRADGSQVWRVVGNQFQPVWYRGQLFAATQSAVVRFDLETGAFEALHCGWNFGLADVSPALEIHETSPCDR